jgi:PAS domain S-box-containing protein
VVLPQQSSAIGGGAGPQEAATPRVSGLSAIARQQLRRLGWLVRLPRGEALIASVGLGAALVLIAAMTASAWWAVWNQRSGAKAAQVAEVDSLGKVLTPTAEAMLAANELSSLRRTVMEAERHYALARCRVLLPGDVVVADADPSNINIKSLPEKWGAGPLDAEDSTEPGEQIIVRKFPLLVSGRGGAMLEIGVTPKAGGAGMLDVMAGLGLIGAAALGVLLLIYRRTRGKMRALGLIREALLAVKSGETGREELSITATGDAPESAAWNELIGQIAELRRKALAEEARTSLGARRGGGGELIAACDALPIGLVVLGESGKVEYGNGAAAVLMGCKREQMEGAEFLSLIQVEHVRQHLEPAVSGRSRQRMTAEAERSDDQGGGVFRFTVRPLRREDGAGTLVTIEDVTQQKVAAASRNTFVAHATHELRTPLTNIRLYVETALADGEQDAPLRAKCLNVINQEVRRLERMVGEMLSVAEIEAGVLKLRQDDVKLERMLGELKEEYAEQAKEKGITLKFDLPPKLPALHADRDKLAVTLHNLIGNAIKYTPGGGTVIVAVKEADAGGRLLIEVADTGFGIEEKELALIFERFYRSRDPRVGKVAGSGLGLTLAKEVAVLHGGDIMVQSQLNKGSTFTLVLPTRKEAA